MNTLLSAMKLDFVLQWRYRIILVAMFISVVYVAALAVLGEIVPKEVVAILLFSDPVVLGFIFTGVMIFYEKDARTLQAIVVTPLRPIQYILSKALTLTIAAMPVAIFIALVALPFTPEYFLRIIFGITATSILFVFWGVVGAAFVRTFNQYILIIPLFMIPLCVPIISIWDVADFWWLHFIPTKATILFISDTEPLQWWEYIYGVGYLILHVWIAGLAALKIFTSKIVQG